MDGINQTPANYLEELNTIQRQAVTQTKGPVLIVAGPGSGKTRVLTYRIAHLLQSGVAPHEILSLTFTNKAAREMKERIERVVGGQAYRVWAGTFHSIFARILRVEAEKIGYPNNFTIYDTDDSKNLIKTLLKEMNLPTEQYNPNTIRSRISSAKSNLITPKLYLENQELREQDASAKMPHLYKIYEKYMVRCKRAGAMDFDDLLLRMYELLQTNPEGVLEKYRQRFRYVMVDEFQDTNYLQYAIVKKLVYYPGSSYNLCVVGDDAQSIYAFRGATIQNILDFEQDFKQHGIQVFKLEQNYRSTEHIVHAANQLITNNSRQIPKTIWSDKGEGNRIRVLATASDQEEGKRVTDAILEHKNRFHLSNSEIAILYRTNAQSRVFEEYLRRYNVNYRVFGGLSFYQRKEVKDLLGYLRLAVNANDEEALRRIINYPKRAIGNTTIDKLSIEADAANTNMWQYLPHFKAPPRTQNAIADFVKMIKGFQKMAATEDAYNTAIHIARQSKLLDLLKADNSIEGLGRTENVNALLDGIKEYVESEQQPSEEPSDRSLASYLQSISLLTDQDQNNQDNDYVTLMSVHSAKGLEFKSVFVVGLEESLFPSFMATETPEGLDEERRLFYVAITRAEQLLCLSYAKGRYRYGSMRFNEPSRFLSEIDAKHLEGVSAAQPATVPVEEPPRGRVQGNFKPPRRNAPETAVDPSTFKPSPGSSIQTGMRVLHLRFGEGKVLNIDGGAGNRVATIQFKDIDDPQKRIMLKFAKLQILD